MRRLPSSTHSPVALNHARAAFYAQLAQHHAAPLWVRLGNLLTSEPRLPSRPWHWSYRIMREQLLTAGNLISAEEAERRVLILENPGLPGSSALTETLYAGLQLILPGEDAPAHRHSPAALRLIIEGEGAYTAVDGERAYMAPGDLILTPSWTWHDHGHEGTGPTIWLDVLDLPTVLKLGPVFTELYPAAHFPTTRTPDTSAQRFGANLRPLGSAPTSLSSPVFSYGFARSRSALLAHARDCAPDPVHGAAMEYVNPANGESAMPTISTFLHRLPAGFAGAPYRTTEGSIFCAIEGRGRLEAGTGGERQVFEWAPGDVFVVPCWCPYALYAGTDAILFRASDRTTQIKLGLWREDRSPGPT